jgi:2-C-methyl-D-erythritol 4-phosphate cytidylyltransferase
LHPRRVGIVVAAGAGERFSGSAGRVPKAFVALGGTSLLVHSTRAMAAACGHLVVVVRGDHIPDAAGLLESEGLHAAVCAGGATRTESVAAGVRACHTFDLGDWDLVGIHDAARPLVSEGLVERVFAALADGWDAAAPGMPVVDTLKLVETHGVVRRTIDRHGVWSVQTPQAFRWGVLARAYAGRTGSATDDLALVERAGGRVRLVQGDPFNLKITYPHDLVLAEALLAQRRVLEREQRA